MASDPDIQMAVREAIMDAMESSQEPARGSNLAVRRNGGINTRSSAQTSSGSALDAVRASQSTEPATYAPSKGRMVATAKTNIAAIMEAGGSLEIINRIHKPDYIEVVVRATSGGRHVDSSMSIYKQEYLAKKAWEWILKVLIDDPGIVTGTDEWGMPEFRPDAMISVRMQDEGKSILVKLPAKIALWREMAREWQFAGRVVESKAYSRAADMLLRGEWQTVEEQAEEIAEIEKVAEGGRAEA